MRRIARKLCLVGLLAFMSACLGLYLFEHMPFPWGTATLPGGISDEGTESALERAMQWQLQLGAVIFAVGFSGALFLLVGGATWLVSWLPKRAR